MAAEEDDEDIWDSWEDVADSGELERRMEEREKQVREKDEKASTSQTSHENKTNSSVMMQEDTNRTLYKPQLRILKRPNSGGTNQGNSQEAAKGKPVHKTLAERQAQYAEARARIMGSASDESNDSEKSEMPRAIQVEQKLPDNVIRLPRGPNDDGSKGFEVTR